MNPAVFETFLGKSAHGNPIQGYSSYPLQDRHSLRVPPFLFVGGVHGDEPEGVWLAEDLLRSLKENATLFPWILVPCLNPDGFFATPRERTNGNAVDLNRNFPSKDWSPEAKAPRYSPGPKPASEPETQLLVGLIQSQKPQTILHFHSWTTPCIVYTGNGQQQALLFESSAGYPARPEIGYPTPGSLGQYGGVDQNIPVICVEEMEQAPREETWKRFQHAFAELLGIGRTA